MIKEFIWLGLEMPEIDSRKVQIANIKHLIELNKERLLSVERLFKRQTRADKKESYRLVMNAIENTLTNLEAQLSGLLSQAPTAPPPSPLPPPVPPALDSNAGGC